MPPQPRKQSAVLGRSERKRGTAEIGKTRLEPYISERAVDLVWSKY
jgi:hypothetical protein